MNTLAQSTSSTVTNDFGTTFGLGTHEVYGIVYPHILYWIIALGICIMAVLLVMKIVRYSRYRKEYLEQKKLTQSTQVEDQDKQLSELESKRKVKASVLLLIIVYSLIIVILAIIWIVMARIDISV